MNEFVRQSVAIAELRDVRFHEGGTICDYALGMALRRGALSFVLSAARAEMLAPIRSSLAAIAPCFALAAREYIPTILGVFHPASRMMAASGAPSSTRSWVAPIRAECPLILRGSSSAFTCNPCRK